MARVKGCFTTRRYRNKILKLAKGYFGSKHRIYRTANEQVMHSLAYAYRDRRNKKRDFRKLWITRVNAAANQCGISYSKLMYGLKIEGIEINRKMLSELAINDFASFQKIAEVAKKAVASGKKPAVKVVPAPKAPVVAAPKVEVKVAETNEGIVIETAKAKKQAAKKTVAKVEEVKPVVKKAAKKTVEKVEEVAPVAVEEVKPVVKKTVKKAVKAEEVAPVAAEEVAPVAKKTVKKTTTKKVAE